MSFRIINRIARTELAALFFSPVAWLLLVVFAVHVGMDLADVLNDIVRIKALSGTINFSATAGMVLGAKGLYEVIQDSIYLYIPLLTMNLMSREYSSGSDKLLYSSPVSSVEIIAGKYLSMLVCSLIFVVILALPAIVLSLYAPEPDYPLVCSALLAMFLLISTYCAIGLLMSCLTQYQVIAAVATLAVLAFFNFVGNIAQDSVWFRHITYWLSIKGRASEMLSGLITSEAIIYFVSVSLFFLTLAVFRLDNQKIRRSALSKTLRYTCLVAALFAVAIFSSRPSLRFFYDATHNKARTLSEASQKVMKELSGPMTITTYVDVQDKEFSSFIPTQQLKDIDRFKLYTRFKSDIKMKYVYYYSPITDTSVLKRFDGMDQEQIAKELAKASGYKKPVLVSAESLKDQIDLEQEKYQFVRVIERKDGAQSRLRLYNDMFHHPSEGEISAAMKRLIAEPVKIASVVGHGERSIRRTGDRDYSIFATAGQFRNSMVNQGFDVVEVDLQKDTIPSDVNILMLADVRTAFEPSELEAIDAFIERGGNMMIVTDVTRSQVIGGVLDRLGLAPGESSGLDDIIPAKGTSKAASLIGGFYKQMGKRYEATAVNMYGAMSFDVKDTSHFRPTPLLTTDTTLAGKPEVFAYALTREREGSRQQRMIVVGDADCYSNSVLQTSTMEKNQSFNFSMLPNSFKWLCYGEFPVSSPRPPIRDNDFTLSPVGLRTVNKVYGIGIPLFIALIGCAVLYRRRRR